MILAVLAGIVGLIFGSFATVLVDRIPSGEQWWSGRSRCETCGTQIHWYDNIPVVSWLVLRGRCRGCGERISITYPVVELVTGAAFVGVALTDATLGFKAVLWFVVVIGVALALIDLRHRRLPDALVLPAYPIVTALLVVDAAVSSSWMSLGRAALGGVIAGVLYGGMWFAYPKGLGWGDVKLAPLLGLVSAYAGWGPLAVGIFAAPFLGLIASAFIARGEGSLMKKSIPYGPWMILGMWVGLMFGTFLAEEYWRAVEWSVS